MIECPPAPRQTTEKCVNRVAAVVALLILSCVVPQADAAEPPAWVKQSDENAQIALAVFARYRPEYAGQTGVAGLDEEIRGPEARRLRSLPRRRQASGGGSAGAAPCNERSARPAGPRNPHQGGGRLHHFGPIAPAADAGLHRCRGNRVFRHSRAARSAGAEGAPGRRVDAAAPLRGARTRHEAAHAARHRSNRGAVRHSRTDRTLRQRSEQESRRHPALHRRHARAVRKERSHGLAGAVRHAVPATPGLRRLGARQRAAEGTFHESIAAGDLRGQSEAGRRRYRSAGADRAGAVLVCRDPEPDARVGGAHREAARL